MVRYPGRFEFNGNDLGHFLHIQSISRSIAPEFRLTEQATTRGEHVALGGLSALEITVKANLKRVRVDDAAALRRALAGMLYSEQAAKLILPDEPDKYYLAWWKGGAELDRLDYWPGAELTFLCADPVAYGEEHEIELTNAAKTVLRGGTYKAYPVIKATPAAGSYWTVTNVTTGELVRVDAAFTGANSLVLDFGAQRCLVNGTNHAVTIESTFFALEESQEIKKLNGTATMTWRERWL